MNKNIKYIHLNEISSTNQWAKDNIDQLDPSLLTCISADTQTRGRGTKGRPWLSPKGNVYCSFVFVSDKEPLELISILAKCVANLYNLQIKGKNDLFLNGKKIGGILAEVSSPFIILGLGLNINLDKSYLKDINQPATSFLIEEIPVETPKIIIKKMSQKLISFK